MKFRGWYALGLICLTFSVHAAEQHEINPLEPDPTQYPAKKECRPKGKEVWESDDPEKETGFTKDELKQHCTDRDVRVEGDAARSGRLSQWCNIYSRGKDDAGYHYETATHTVSLQSLDSDDGKTRVFLNYNTRMMTGLGAPQGVNYYLRETKNDLKEPGEPQRLRFTRGKGPGPIGGTLSPEAPLSLGQLPKKDGKLIDGIYVGYINLQYKDKEKGFEGVSPNQRITWGIVVENGKIAQTEATLRQFDIKEGAKKSWELLRLTASSYWKGNCLVRIPPKPVEKKD